MAMSSIFSNVRIEDLEKADAFVDVLSKAAALSRENKESFCEEKRKCVLIVFRKKNCIQQLRFL